MPRPLPLVLAVVVVAAAVVAWRMMGDRDPSAEVVPAEAPAPTTESAPAPVDVAVPGTPAPEGGGAVPVAEAVARAGERLPDLRVGERGRVARFRPEVFRAGMELSGEALLKGLVDARDVWVRWDAEATRERFLQQRFPVPGMQVLESGEAIVFVEPMPALFRHVGFSCRLDGSVLRIGAEGVYRPDEPPPGPSPR